MKIQNKQDQLAAGVTIKRTRCQKRLSIINLARPAKHTSWKVRKLERDQKERFPSNF